MVPDKLNLHVAAKLPSLIHAELLSKIAQHFFVAALCGQHSRLIEERVLAGSPSFQYVMIFNRFRTSVGSLRRIALTSSGVTAVSVSTSSRSDGRLTRCFSPSFVTRLQCATWSSSSSSKRERCG